MVGLVQKHKSAVMTAPPSFKDYVSVSRHPRLVSSVVISVGLLVLFITWNSWILLSCPTGSLIPNDISEAGSARDFDSLASLKDGRMGEDDHNKESVEVAAIIHNSITEDSHKGEVLVSLSNETVPTDVTAGEEPTDSSKDLGAASNERADDSDCDLYHGQWYYDTSGPLYTNNTCPILTQSQNCQGNGRPDKEYENWRWKPSCCELPRFNATRFLELMSGKTLTFVGDSVARNQMESLICILWQVEAPVNRGNRRMQRWYFRSKSVTIIRIWSAWLVHTTEDPFSYVPEGIPKIHLDVPDESFMQLVPSSDVVILSNGHWFPKKSAYVLGNEIVGTQLWSAPEPQAMNVSNMEAYRITTETSLTAMVTHPNYSGLTILMTYSPDHYENGAWNTGGSCTGKERPLLPGQLVDNEYTKVMHEKQVTGFHQAIKKRSNQSKLKLMDITEALGYRHDGHPGPYRSTDPNKITKRGPNGRPPSQDCLHWCMPGPVDTWNELLLEVLRREFEGNRNSVL